MNKILRDCEIYWGHLRDVDQYGSWSAKVFLSPSAVKKLTDAGVGDKIKIDSPNSNGNVDKEGEKYIRLRKKAEEDAVAPSIIDTSGVPIKGLVGNGSKGNIKVDIYEYKHFGGGIAVRLEAIQLTHYIPYEEGEDFEMLEEETTVGEMTTKVAEETTTSGDSDNPF